MNFFYRLSAAQRSLVGAAAGFMFYGGWAYWVNLGHGPMAALRAGCVQGGYSFILTLCMTLLLEGIFRTLSRHFRSTLLVNCSTIIICCALIFSGSWMVNSLAGTPEVLRTVILGYVIGAIYSSSYVYGLAKAKRAQ